MPPHECKVDKLFLEFVAEELTRKLDFKHDDLPALGEVLQLGISVIAPLKISSVSEFMEKYLAEQIELLQRAIVGKTLHRWRRINCGDGHYVSLNGLFQFHSEILYDYKLKSDGNCENVMKLSIWVAVTEDAPDDQAN